MAFNAVVAPGSVTATAQVKSKKTEWPDALKTYVGKAFENVLDADRPALEEFLKSMITKAFESSSVWTTDWAKEPLPILSQTVSRPHENGHFFLSGRTSDVSFQNDQSSVSKAKRKKSRFDVPEIPAAGLAGDTDDQKAKRARRFEDSAIKAAVSSVPMSSTINLGFSEGVPDYDEFTIIGHATKLEKSYLRLTSAPDPGTVRPLPVLKDALELLKRKWKEDANYAYICDQFKSLRQDLTVQRIKNEFTITVYEIHARIALEKSDLGEYNQCQTQLQTLYKQMPDTGHPLEFLAYRILYMLHTRNLTEINTVLVNMTLALRQDPSIAHALSVRKSLACNNYPRLFKLYLEAPNMSGYLMDNFIDRERVSAMAIVCRAYRPTIDLNERLARVLGFSDVDELTEYLIGIGDDNLTASIISHSIGVQPENSAENVSVEDRGAKHSKVNVSFSLNTKQAGDCFESKRKSMGGVDIKGQI
ncbi:UPF0666 protein C2A9.11c [Taphrina deformans PYCC 5710]|uniref:UPF0666 protein C2A9.11c n=1 Tax=Taphrina deformans (strain PYCC 5710 / ATCC 11124 / CBS 356.35 / IMI 108563 / JCM 9778 / NBRC 8474) TaxID=1097556 RepID=R4XCL6_TAPDE|nr:UPF0666 protein C2A9.11c [Taphrina deformans PYCC 5710]|eukprot:CCG83630.1 UPF0666 protein C2A9.11c [Taphrina deformans PYCC 5710]